MRRILASPFLYQLNGEDTLMPRGIRPAGSPPINKHSSPLVCMVVGCGRAALYRETESTRGYCGLYKYLAFSAPRLESAVDYYEWFDHRGSAKPSLDYYDNLGAVRACEGGQGRRYNEADDED